MKTPSIQDRASRATRCLEKTWQMLRKLQPELPQAVMVIIAAGPRRRRLGHFSGAQWRYRARHRIHEVGVSPGLFRHYEDLLAVLLHEAAHAVLYEKDGTSGCGPDGYYHKHGFRDTCLSLGLECKFRNTRYGWTDTQWPPRREIPRRYQGLLTYLKRHLPLGTGGKQLYRSPGRKTPQSGHVRMICRCEDLPRCIYVNKSVLAQGEIVCNLCGRHFRPVEK